MEMYRKFKLVAFNGFKKVSEFYKIQLVCMILLFLGVAMSIIAPSYIGKLIDSVKENSLYDMKYNLIKLISLTLISIIIGYYQNRKYNYFEAKVSCELRNNVMKKVTDISFDKWNTYSIGNLNTILDKDCLSFSNFIINETSSSLTYLFTFIGINIFILTIDKVIGTFSILSVVGFIVIQKKYMKTFQRLMIDLKKHEAKTSSFSNDILNNMENYFLVDNVNTARNLYENSNSELFDFVFKLKNKYYFSSIISQTFNVIVIVCILIIWIKFRRNMLSAGQVVNLIIYSQRLYSPLFRLSELGIKFKEFSVSVDRIYNLLNETSIKYGKKELKRINKVSVRNLNLKVRDRNLYNDCSFEIKRGDILGITGENGSGKSTLVRILKNYIEDYDGEIYYDEIKIKDLSKKSILNIMSIMPQKISVTNEEVAKVKEYLIKNKIERYIDIDALEYGEMYSHKENSGGELQKISFIKTILENKDMIILDEPTSSMDMNGEEYTAEILKKISYDKIVIIITHRQYLLSICNKRINLN